MADRDAEARQVAAWWATLGEHQSRDGWCVICRTVGCQRRAEAFRQLAIRGEFTREMSYPYGDASGQLG